MALGFLASGIASMFKGSKPKVDGAAKKVNVKPKSQPTSKAESATPKQENTEPTSAPTVSKAKGPSSPLLRKTGLVTIDAATKNISKALGKVKGTLYSTEKFNKDKRDRARKAAAKGKRKKRESKFEGLSIGGVVGVVGSLANRIPFIDRIKNFAIQIILGSIVSFLVKQLPIIIEEVKKIKDQIVKAIETIDKFLIQPIWNAAKVIIGPIAKELAKMTGLPDFQAEANTIEENLLQVAGEVPVVGGLIKQIENVINGFPTLDSQQSAPPSQQPPATRSPSQQPTTSTGGAAPSSQPSSTPSSGGGYDMKLARLLKDYEGMRTDAYLDSVGIPTIGMGATYYPKGFRLKGNVKMGDTITEEEALWIKTQHIKEHRERLLKELPITVYNKLPDGVKAALESKVFNYGSLGAPLTRLVTKASETGNYKPVADYFRNVLAKHDGGINSWRRNDEATLIMTGKSARNQVNFGGSTPPAQVQPQTPMIPSGTVQGDPVVTSAYGKMRGGRPHGGLDIAAPSGTPLRAVTDGEVVDYGSLSEGNGDPSGWGNFVVFRDSKGLYHLYGHVLASGMVKGGNVKAGQQIALTGSTGRSSGPHLHWETGTGWTGGVLTGKSDPLSHYDFRAPYTVQTNMNPNRTEPNLNRSASYDKKKTSVVIMNNGGANAMMSGGSGVQAIPVGNGGGSNGHTYLQTLLKQKLSKQ